MTFLWRCETLTDPGMKRFGESLKSHASLKVISLDFTECNGFGDQAMQGLGEGLKGLNSLETLNLYFIG